MEAGDLRGVDHVVEPLPGRRAAAAEARDLPVGRVQCVAEDQEQSDADAGQRRGGTSAMMTIPEKVNTALIAVTAFGVSPARYAAAASNRPSGRFT